MNKVACHHEKCILVAQYKERREQEPKSHEVSSLVIDGLCKQAKGQTASVACFYSQFVTKKSGPDEYARRPLKQGCE